MAHAERKVDVMTAARLQALAATLGVEPPVDHVPALWHLILFQTWVPPHELGADGHPRSRGFLPTVPELPRRLAAGFTVEFHSELPLDVPLERVSTIASVEDKRGRSGRLRFVTVEHRIGPAGTLCLREFQHLVYREAAERATEVRARHDGVPATDGASDPALPITQTASIDPVTLFRYSALAGVGHRIHYDADYARDVEGYPGLVVHGPLQALLLAGLASSEAFGTRALARFAARSLRPAFTTTVPLSVEGESVEGGARLQTRDAAGRVCMTAEVRWA